MVGEKRNLQSPQESQLKITGFESIITPIAIVLQCILEHEYSSEYIADSVSHVTQNENFSLDDPIA